ncbi:hypothetical protein, partial [Pusillimonas noertemannii]|uniref:hypothetical protein n=1 Tax=Pusillimonas noertemannii TaxID=305977 RepID=UPI001AD9306E
SWHSPVKVGHRQALTPQSPRINMMRGLCLLRADTKGRCAQGRSVNKAAPITFWYRMSRFCI